MEERANRSRKPKQRQWEWHSNIYDLKTSSNDLTQIWNCSPYVMICAGKSNTDEDPEININIEMNRNFKWNEAVGWNWHKSWNIPTISVSFSVGSADQIFDKTSMQEIEPPVNLIAQLYVAKLATNANNTIYFVDVPVKGSTFQDIVDGRAVFDGLKFETTSYNHHVAAVHRRAANSTS